MYYPNEDEFKQLATKGNLIPVTRQILADFDTPVSAYWKLRGKGETFLFESVEGGEHLGRYSFVGCNPKAVIRQWDDQVELCEQGKPKKTSYIKRKLTDAGSSDVQDALEVVEAYLTRYQPVTLPALPNRFTGGAVGFIGYEFIHDVESVVPCPERNELGTPTVYFLITDELLVFDRVSQTITIIVNAKVEIGTDSDLTSGYQAAVGRIKTLIKALSQPVQYKPASLHQDAPPLDFQSNMEKDRFLTNVIKAKNYIRAGDIIQVVGSQRFSAPVSASPLDVYRAARSINPSPYMFLLELESMALVGASPEIHVRSESGQVEIRPIAGTRPRGKTREQDLANEAELLADPKERAEHVMLVDLARNDIGRVCEFESVQVKDFMVIERYSHVMHIVSQVEGRLTRDKTSYDLMRATFPAGTLSGAPKVRAMQIISEFEKTQRGPYGGCVGYFSYSGNLDCCITIRTALMKDGKAYVQAGGGWVNDSNPEMEYQETINKAKSMIKTIALAESFSPA
ncbi:MAG: Anthranilate synthase component 1 [Verrucomicrobia subdivision 3 bacterium]|nr:Anthranilate synthase component 1 [Limisphaerales bacterium]MCS1413772.1 Anthranilate synthase component 1 [Limisphaerales bacterium]